MISLALQGEIFTSYFFGLIFAISLSLKITVISRYVCCVFQVVSLEEHKMTWLEKLWAPHSPGSEGRQMPSPVGDIVSLLSRWPRWLFCTRSFLIHSSCFLLRLVVASRNSQVRRQEWEKQAFSWVTSLNQGQPQSAYSDQVWTVVQTLFGNGLAWTKGQNGE